MLWQSTEGATDTVEDKKEVSKNELETTELVVEVLGCKNLVMFRKQFTKKEKSRGEINTLPSMTIPDDSLSIRQIIERYASGLVAPISYEKVYSEDNPDIRGLDIVELHVMAEHNQEVINGHLDKFKKAKAEKEAQERLEFEKFKLEKQKDNSNAS